MILDPVLVNGALAGIIVTILSYYLNRLTTTVEKLNENMAAIIERTTQHEKLLGRHDERLSSIESRVAYKS